MESRRLQSNPRCNFGHTWRTDAVIVGWKRRPAGQASLRLRLFVSCYSATGY